VRRGGQRLRLPSADLVPGDVVLLQSGDSVPADLRLFEVRNLHCDESALTGESLPVAKHSDPLDHDLALADRKNQAYAGTLVTAGQAEGLVWATGDKTETGRIAWLISEAIDISTPLTKKIAQFSRLLLWIILSLAAVTFAVGVGRGEPAVDMFMAAVALAVGAIPEGLPAAVTIVLAIGVNRMARRRAIIRKLPAVETLGSTTVICSDKTGTLTENQMTVQEIRAAGIAYQVTGGGYHPDGEILHEGVKVDPATHPALMECLRAGVLCNDSRIVIDEGQHTVQGDPTEAALLVAGAKGGLIHAETTAAAPLIDTIPFESDHMFRATLHAPEGQARVIYKVGAVERLLDRCDEALGSDGLPAPLDRDAIRESVDQMAAQGLRVLAFARRHTTPDHDTLGHEHVREGLTFLGLQGMIDPPRAEAIAAVANCRRAGILVKMITGDHAVTARVIAARVGLADAESAVDAITGLELEKIRDEDLPAVAEETEVFARVAPEQKLRLVKALQSRGHVVAMTGDGVNDAPRSNRPTSVSPWASPAPTSAKEAADMILTDDNFASIEAAVEEGRGVFDNLTKFIVWTLPDELGEGHRDSVAVFAGTTLPILPVQLALDQHDHRRLARIDAGFRAQGKGPHGPPAARSEDADSNRMAPVPHPARFAGHARRRFRPVRMGAAARRGPRRSAHRGGQSLRDGGIVLSLQLPELHPLDGLGGFLLQPLDHLRLARDDRAAAAFHLCAGDELALSFRAHRVGRVVADPGLRAVRPPACGLGEKHYQPDEKNRRPIRDHRYLPRAPASSNRRDQREPKELPGKGGDPLVQIGDPGKLRLGAEFRHHFCRALVIAAQF
jgi:cation-transporting P-type ATPase F